MAPPQPIVVLDPLPIMVLDPQPWNRSTVTEFALHELVNGGQLAPNVEGSPPVWIVPLATDREPNPPYGYVISFIRHHERGFAAPASRFMRTIPPLRGGASQLRPQRDFAGNHLHRRLRGVPGDPRELGPLGPFVPRGAAHARHGRDTGAPGGARRRPVDLAAGHTQGVLPALHDDIQQCGVGEGVVLPS
jgi:hypothetical protein